VEKFIFSPKSIHGLSTTLYQCVQDETLRVYDDRELEHEILSLQTRETPAGWRFDHRRGGYSDRVVALSMALQTAVKTRMANQPMRLPTAWKARARADAQREFVQRGLTFRSPGGEVQPARSYSGRLHDPLAHLEREDPEARRYGAPTFSSDEMQSRRPPGRR
jgi:hypothetical protein